MIAMASQITSLTIVYSIVYSGTDERKHQSSVALALAFVRGIHRGPVISPHKGPVMWKMFLFDDVIMDWLDACTWWCHDMETLSASLALCEGNPPITCDLPPQKHKKQVTWTFDVSLLSSWTSCWTNNQVASDLRHPCAYVMTAMTWDMLVKQYLKFWFWDDRHICKNDTNTTWRLIHGISLFKMKVCYWQLIRDLPSLTVAYVSILPSVAMSYISIYLAKCSNGRYISPAIWHLSVRWTTRSHASLAPTCSVTASVGGVTCTVVTEHYWTWIECMVVSEPLLNIWLRSTEQVMSMV